MGRNIYFTVSLFLLVIMFGAVQTPRAHPQDVVLAQGNPPLTQSMVDKSVGFLEWSLEVRMSPEHRSMLEKVLMRAWQTNSQAEMKSTLDIVDLHDKLVQMSEVDRQKLERPDGTVYRDDGVGGSGTYLIEQNTLELRYSDGRIKRFPFIAFPENLAKKPALDSFILRAQETMTRY